MIISKQLLPVYDKPMIYYLLSVLMLACIKGILIISTLYDLQNLKKFLGDGHEFGINLSYVEQPSTDSLAQAFILGEKFIGDDDVAMILGDNIYYRNGTGCKSSDIWLHYENNPEIFGIVDFDRNGKMISAEEKPGNLKSNYCIKGLYFYDNRVVGFAKKVKLSARRELRITDLNLMYLEEESLDVPLLGRGYAWFDTSTIDSR